MGRNFNINTIMDIVMHQKSERGMVASLHKLLIFVGILLKSNIEGCETKNEKNDHILSHVVSPPVTTNHIVLTSSGVVRILRCFF